MADLREWRLNRPPKGHLQSVEYSKVNSRRFLSCHSVEIRWDVSHVMPIPGRARTKTASLPKLVRDITIVDTKTMCYPDSRSYLVYNMVWDQFGEESKDTIETIGYECEVVAVEPVSEKSLDAIDAYKTVLSIGGMTCSSCESAISRGLLLLWHRIFLGTSPSKSWWKTRTRLTPGVRLVLSDY